MIVANELRTKGVGVIESELAEHDEAVITIKGKPRYVVTTIERYEQMREAELDAAYLNYKESKGRGEVETLSAEEHLKDIRNAL